MCLGMDALMSPLWARDEVGQAAHVTWLHGELFAPPAGRENRSAGRHVRAGMPTSPGEGALLAPSPQLPGDGASEAVGERASGLLEARMAALPAGLGCTLSSTPSTHQARPLGRQKNRPGWAKGQQGQTLSVPLGFLEFKAQATSSLLQHPGGPAVYTPRDA